MNSAALASDKPPIEVIADRYRIERRLGRGGMGSVWRAEHLTLHSPVAVKLIDVSLAASDEARARFLREAQSAALLRSPHVVQILDHGIHEGIPYIAMELLEGESLAERIERIGKLPAADIVCIMSHVARAMSRAHAAGIVHRDLKPDNVFLVQNDDEEIAKVLDFGIAKADSALSEVTTGTRTGSVMGTPHYMSPEQAEGSKQLDHRADLWAMGVMTFECVTGKRPFEGPSLGSVLVQICSKPIPVPSQVADVPAGFDAWFKRATQREPSERFQSAKELVLTLRGALDPNTAPGPDDHRLDPSSAKLSLDVGLRVSSSPDSGIPGVTRTPWGWLAAAVLLAAGAGAWWMLRSDPVQEHVATPAQPAARATTEVLPEPALPALRKPQPDEAAPSEAVAQVPQEPQPIAADTAPAPEAPAAADSSARDKPSSKHVDKRVTKTRPAAPAVQSVIPAPAAPAKPDLGF